MDRICKSKKLVIWGAGKLLGLFDGGVLRASVVAIVDQEIQKQGTIFLDYKILSPDILRETEYDYVVIGSTKYHKEIAKQLVTEYQIPTERIKSIHYLWSLSGLDYRLKREQYLQEVAAIIENYNVGSILDISMLYYKMETYIKTLGGIADVSRTAFTGINKLHKQIPAIYHNVYDEIYSNYKACSENHYDMILGINIWNDYSCEEIMDIIRTAEKKVKYIVFLLSSEEEKNNWLLHDLPIEHSFYVKELSYFNVFILDNDIKTEGKNDAAIYVAAHKDFIPPDDSLYYPVQAGRNHRKALALGYLRDNEGDNISCLNPLINECTVLYWIWKNTDCKYAGLNHYRRYFVKNKYVSSRNNLLHTRDVIEILKDYDIIVAEELFFRDKMKDILYDSVDHTAYDKALKGLKEVMLKRYPQDWELFEEFLEGNSMFPYHLFVTRREILNEYCSWLFDIIIEVAEKDNFLKYDSYSQRIVGFLAERLFTIWLMKSSLKIKEMPVLFEGDPEPV